jgi:ABC-2 type transport system ATP-binding protein
MSALDSSCGDIMMGWRNGRGVAAMLQVRRLEKVIEQRTVLSIEDLAVAQGEVVAVNGPVGSGKTLLMRLLSGELAPSGGSVTLDGQDVHRTPAARQRLGVLFEDDLLYKRHSPEGNLLFHCRLHGLPRGRALDLLTQVGLGDQARQPVYKLAKSAQRRLAFARALLTQPAALLLDRPTLRTDLDTQALFTRLIAQAAAGGAAVLIAEEDLAWAGKSCSRVVELEDGRVVSGRSVSVNNAPGDATPAPAPERLIPFKVPARKDDRIVLYDPGDLLYATSRDGRTILRTATEEATTNLTLQELETRLAGRGFFKAHRAYLVNLQHIKAVIQFTRNSYTLQLNDGHDTMIPLSKQSEKELQELLGY